MKNLILSEGNWEGYDERKHDESFHLSSTRLSFFIYEKKYVELLNLH